MVTILREADTKPVPDVAKKHGVSGQTIYSWRKHFGSLEPSDVKRLRQLEQENGRLKKMVADRDLELDQGDHEKKMVGARVRRQQVGIPDHAVCPTAARAPCSRWHRRGLPVATGRAGCPGAGRDASFGGPVPALRISARHSEQLAASGDCQQVVGLNHRSAFAHRSRPSALDKKSFSIVS